MAPSRQKFDPASDFVIVEGRLLWHIGVVGIVASRVLQEFYRPTLIIGGENGEMRGSGRSIAGFDLAAALRECDDCCLRHGGHAMAAGLSVRPENLDALRARLNTIARRHPQARRTSSRHCASMPRSACRKSTCDSPGRAGETEAHRHGQSRAAILRPQPRPPKAAAAHGRRQTACKALGHRRHR